jgi:hypothetical protein
MEVNLHCRPTNGEPLTDPTRYRHIVGESCLGCDSS